MASVTSPEATFGAVEGIVDLLLPTILATIVANIVFWFGLGVVFAVVLKVGQGRMRKFFGIAGGKSLHVCLSNLYDPHSASPRPSSANRCYIGRNELEASRAIDRLFSTAIFRVAGMAEGLIDKFFSFNTMKPVMSVCPDVGRSGDEYEHLYQPLIVIGGSRWNTVRRHFLAANVPIIRSSRELNPDEWRKLNQDDPPRPECQFQFEVTRGRQMGISNTRYPALAMLERCTTNGVTVFFCSGSRGDVTRMTVEYLVRNWRKLYKTYGKKTDFAVFLDFVVPAGGTLTHYVGPADEKHFMV